MNIVRSMIIVIILSALLFSVSALSISNHPLFISNLQSLRAQEQQPSILVKIIHGEADTGAVNVSATINTYKANNSVLVNSTETDVLLTIPSTASVGGNSEICAVIISSHKQTCQNFTDSGQTLNIVTLDLLQAH
jgi:hypothetical protein